jgi:hypothetical protein
MHLASEYVEVSTALKSTPPFAELLISLDRRAHTPFSPPVMRRGVAALPSLRTKNASIHQAMQASLETISPGCRLFQPSNRQGLLKTRLRWLASAVRVSVPKMAGGHQSVTM